MCSPCCGSHVVDECIVPRCRTTVAHIARVAQLLTLQFGHIASPAPAPAASSMQQQQQRGVLRVADDASGVIVIYLPAE